MICFALGAKCGARGTNGTVHLTREETFVQERRQRDAADAEPDEPNQ